MALPPKGTPQRSHRDSYQKTYRKSNYFDFHLMLDRRSERDMAILDGLNKLPYKTKTEFMKRAIEKELGLVRTEKEYNSPTDRFIAELDSRG